MKSLSIIIATKNESHNIKECLEYCQFANEVLVLDSGSTDGTQELSRSMGATVIETDWPGYGPQQNRGIQLAKSDWILSLDADERINEALKHEILEVLSNPQADGYKIPRISSFCGQFIHHSGWRPDYTLRLAKRHKAYFTEHFLHAHMEVNGKQKKLTQSIIHYSYRNLNDVLEKLNRYSTGNAKDLFQNGRARPTLTTALVHGLWAFLRTYFLKLGFLDGGSGLMLSIYNAECTYYKYLKVREIITNEKKPPLK
jgi:glycosyltransferase involved in cell wall biosynthesis